MELLGKSRDELRALCVALGEPAYRGDQLYRALYAERIFDLSRVTGLPTAFREKLVAETTVTLPTVRQRYGSTDGSVRYLFGLAVKQKLNTEGTENRVTENTEKTARKTDSRPASVEAVFMPSEARQTICISTQAGCAVDCQFCMTAQLGLIRNLTAGEILAQVLLPLEEQKENLTPQTNVVLMGQGEPLLNYENVMAAMNILLDQAAMGLAPKHVTMSTSGIVPGIERLAKETRRPKLAISLNASSDAQRDVLMPINKKYPLNKLLAACRNFPRGSREYITFEYVLLGGVNDTAEDARRVARLMSDLGRVKVNLIPWNPGSLPYREPTDESIERFHKILLEKGIPAFTRYSRGRDVMAACGQLALSDIGKPQLPILHSDYEALMGRVQKVNAGRKFTRDEMNER
jgi:23S rRNA (adenine2503-C2)-methyltransferase